MPSLQDIERFKVILNSLGDEPEILEGRQEEIEDISPPEEGLPAELSELLETAAGAPSEEEMPPGEGEPPGEGRPGAEGLGIEELPEEPTSALDFESLFAEGEEVEGEEVEGEEGAEAPEAPPVLEGEEGAEAPAAEVPELELPEVEMPAGELPVEEIPSGELPEGEVPEEFALPTEAFEAAEPEIPPTGEEFELPAEFQAPEEETPVPGEEAPGEEVPLPAEEAPGEEAPGEGAPLPGEEALGPELPSEEEFEAPTEEIEAPIEEFELPPEMEEQEVPAAEVPEAEVPEEGVAEGFEGLEEFELPAEFQAPEEETPVAEGFEAEAPVGVFGPGEELEIPGEGEAPAEQAGIEAPAEQAGIEAPAEGAEMGAGIAEGAEQPVPEMPVSGEAEEGFEAEEIEIDEFSLQGLGEEFGVSEEEAGEIPEEGFGEVGLEVPAEAGEEIEAAEELIELTEEQFDRLKRSLSYLPKNLKMLIEELIGEQNLSGESLKNLVDLLVGGATPVAVAAEVARITGKRVVIPRQFEKRTGLAFEEERRTFAYAFRENILPIIKVFGLSAIFLSLLFFLGVRYIYRPIYANSLYRRGYVHVEADRYLQGNESFARAVNIWSAKGWFYRYAEAFTEKNQYLFATQKYDELLVRYQGDRRGILDYAHLESRYLANYEKAKNLLNTLLEKNVRDYDALLAMGDNYLEWAEEDTDRLEDARFSYATILDYYGEKEEVLFRMLKYFIRTDQLGETVTLKNMIESKKLKIDPEVYAELGGYLFDRKEFDEVPDTLFKAMEVNRELPEIHYNLARYFEYAQDPREEEKAINNSIHYLEASLPLNKKRLNMLIDSYNRLGKSYWREKEYLDAEKWYQRAVGMIEDAQKRKIFAEKSDFGEVYKNLGDIYYYVDRNLDTAMKLYRLAEENLYRSPDVNYKIGYIQYAGGVYEEAMLRFSRVMEDFPNNENALYSLANTLYHRMDFFSAQGYYLHLLDIMENRKDRIPFLRIQDNLEHKALIEYIMKTYNNLGVTLKKLSEQTGDPEKNSTALVDLTFSSEYFDFLTRYPETLRRGLTKNLAFLNQKGILYPQSGFELQIYNRLPNNLETINF